jgi:ATP-binding cassette subfamily B protein
MVASLRRLLPFVAEQRRAYIVGLAAALASTVLSLIAPWVLKLAVDDLSAGVTRTKLALYGLVLLAVALGSALMRYWMRLILMGASRHIEFDLRRAFFARLQALSSSYYQRMRTGDLMSRATNDLGAVRMMIGPAVMHFASTLVLFVVALALMFSMSVSLTLMGLVALPLVSLSVHYFGSAIHTRFERIQAQLSELSAIAQEALAGVRVVRAYGQEAFELARFRLANEEYVARNRDLIRVQSFFFPSMGFFLGVGGMLVLWLGSRQAIAGELTIGEFVAFNSYLVMLSWPMIAFGWVTNLLQRGMASWERMLEVMDARPEVRDEGTARLQETGGIRGAIELRDLTFAYDGQPVLQGVSVRIAAGETVAIVGPTGSGKSTLVALLPRLFEPPRGTVFIDGVDVRDIPLDVLRGAIGMVPQEPFLFSDTVGGNVAFGRQEDPADAGLRQAVAHAAEIACLDRDVADFPNRYDTMVGERGLTLSGGQKQRTAIARALLADPRILILDDALSAVDTDTEDAILSRLREVMRQRTCLVVSHRVSTVRDADVILVLEGGRITERGTHEELVGGGGFYAALHRKQLLEEELAAS